jgi:hypothetical protein
MAFFAPVGATQGTETEPMISPLTATFVQAEFATHYSISAIDPDGDRLTFEWTLEPPQLDPGCTNLGQLVYFDHGSHGQASSEFTWFHGDQHGCDHTKMGPQGHLGFVDVVVRDGQWECKASYLGTEDGFVEPFPCRPVPAAKPPPPPPPKGGGPGISPDQKQRYQEVAEAASANAGGAAALALALALTPSPDPVTKGGAVVCLLVAGFDLVIAVHAKLKAGDPPDPHYRILARPRTPTPPKVAAGEGISSPEAAAINALLTSTARYVGVARATLASLQRAQGAFNAGDRVWQRRQSRLAARYALAEAKLLLQFSTLRARVVAALAATGKPFAVAPVDVFRAQAELAKNDLPSYLVTALRRFGLTDRNIQEFRTSVFYVDRASAVGDLLSTLRKPAMEDAERAEALLLKALAASLRK